ncbi:MAG: hypothetical protein RMX65_018625 [Nostoc sp. DedQUE01]
MSLSDLPRIIERLQFSRHLKVLYDNYDLPLQDEDISHRAISSASK